MNESMLISMVRNHPILYDRYRADFRDTIKRGKAWSAISQAFNISVEDCMRSWRNVRERYAKELKLLKTSADGTKQESKWNLFDNVSFLQPYIKPRLKQGFTSEYTNTMKEILLIAQVKKYPALYDKHSDDFKDAAKKDTAWNAIADVLSMSVVECMRTWRNIRERYAKQLKMIKTSGNYSLCEPKWGLFKKLSFLAPHIKPRKVFTRLQITKNDSLSSEVDSKFILNNCEEVHKLEDPLYTELNEELQESSDSLKSVQSGAIITDQPVQEYIVVPTSSEPEPNQTFIDESNNYSPTKNQPSTSDIAFGNYVGQYLSEMVDTRKKNKLKISVIQLLHGDDT